ncbi:MAG: MBL fold metallo-hydrolase [Colwellia sp.]|jgi:Predicted hydrolase (metallo-beta-lactamase superfamily)
MGYEVDFMGVGSESKSGDAIALRFGNLHGSRQEQTVVVIDGGFSDNGAELVEHIKAHYQTDQVDIVINTHPDQDHINGLEIVLNELQVSELWIHQPWRLSDGIADHFKDGRVTDNSIGERLKANLEKAYSLVELAESKDIIIREPFTGLQDSSGAISLLGPSQGYYESLIPDFEGMPERVTEAATGGVFDKAIAALKKIVTTWGEDKIADDGETSAKNNSSVITQIIVDDRRLVFTGDAGIDALEQAADQIDLCVSGAQLKFIQIPHHGSKRNVGKSVLNRLIGEPTAEGDSRGITAIASTAKGGAPKHPRKVVMNAFTHRGVKAIATRGNGVRHHNDAPDREGWNSISPEPYHYNYEEEEA